MGRHQFLASLAAAGAMAGLAKAGQTAPAPPSRGELLAGQGTVEITLPLGIELAGYHRTPGNQRRLKGHRMPTHCRALVLRRDDTGLAIRRGWPLADTLVVGYTDGMIGYLPDPKAYGAGEYAAVTVPKILGWPPFVPGVARQMRAAAIRLLESVAG